MAKRKKRGLGRLRAELRPRPLFLILTGGTGVLVLLAAVVMLAFLVCLPVSDPFRIGSIKGALVTLFILLGLGGAALLVIALLQRSSGLRVYEQGVVYRRFWGKRTIHWLDVRDVYQQHKGGYQAGEYYVPDHYWWTLDLKDGTRYDFSDFFYDDADYTEVMVALIAEFKRFREAWNLKFGPV
jgi:hypothetical protein